MGTYWDTLVVGSVGKPGRATFGASPSPGQTATGGSSFDGTTGAFADGESFPMMLNSLQSNAGGLAPSSAHQGATVSFDTSANNNYATLSIPGLDITAQIYWSPIDVLTQVLSYVVLGTWAEPKSSSGEYGSITTFAFGYETAKAAMPTSGTATFIGLASATVLKPIDGSIRAAYVAGTGILSVNFGAGSISGTFTDMKQSEYVSYAQGTGHVGTVTGNILGSPVGSIPWNDVSVTASILSGTNRFTGSATATSAPNAPFALSNSATGHIDGAFYGPAAENIGALWSLSDGTSSALGIIGAGR